MNWKQRKQEQKRLAKQHLNIKKETVGGNIYREGGIRLEEYLPTSDDWSPNYPGNLVRVSLMINIAIGNSKYNRLNGNNWHRISVWGDDDTGLIKDFEGDSSIEAVKCFYYLKQLKDITFNKLYELGFEHM